MHTCAQVKTKRDEAQHKKEQKAAERVRQAAEKASKAASAGKGRSGAGKERGGAGIGGAGRGGDGPERGVRPIDLDGGDDPPPRGKPPAPAPAHVTREASEAREALIVAAKQNQALAEQVAELQAKLAARPPDSTTAGREEGTHAPQAAREHESAERTPMASGGLPPGWKRARDSEGRIYYSNKQLHTSQYEYPTERDSPPTSAASLAASLTPLPSTSGQPWTIHQHEVRGSKWQCFSIWQCFS